MLRLLDSYVLDVLGLLDESTRQTLEQQAPTLARVLGVSAASWQGIVELTMDLPSEFSDAVMAAWVQFRSEQVGRGVPADPIEFTHLTVDHLIGER